MTVATPVKRRGCFLERPLSEPIDTIQPLFTRWIMRMLSRDYFPLRAVIYIALVALAFQGIVSGVKQFGWETVILEGGIVELVQAGILLSLVFLWGALAYRDGASRGLFLCIALLAGFAFVREFNNLPLYGRVLPAQAKGALAALVFALVLWRYWRTVPEAVRAFVARPAFLLCSFGGGIVVLWAQVLTQRELLNPRADRGMEESLELAGYMLILFGTLEEYFAQMEDTPGRHLARDRHLETAESPPSRA
jgi:hypothetical protein